MGKFCHMCGYELEQEDVFCYNCGTALQDTAAAPNPKLLNIINIIRFNKKALFIGVGGLALLIAVVVLITTIFGGGYKKAIDNQLEVFYHGELDKLQQLYPEEYWERYEELNVGNDFSDIEEAYETYVDYTIDYYEDEYGDDYEIKYKVTDNDKLSKRELEEIAEALEDQYDIDEKTVKKAYELEVDFEVKGSEGDDEFNEEMTVVKIGGDWYLINCNENGDGEMSVYFSMLGRY